MSVTQLLARPLNTNEKYIEWDKPKDEYLKIRIDNLSEEPLNYDSLIYLYHSDIYKIKVDAYEKNVNGFELTVVDSALLRSFERPCESALIKYRDGLFRSVAMRLSAMANIIDQNSDSYFTSFSENEKCYNLSFKVDKDVNEMNDHLNQLGLRFKSRNFETTFYLISAHEKN